MMWIRVSWLSTDSGLVVVNKEVSLSLLTRTWDTWGRCHTLSLTHTLCLSHSLTHTLCPCFWARTRVIVLARVGEEVEGLEARDDGARCLAHHAERHRSLGQSAELVALLAALLPPPRLPLPPLAPDPRYLRNAKGLIA